MHVFRPSLGDSFDITKSQRILCFILLENLWYVHMSLVCVFEMQLLEVDRLPQAVMHRLVLIQGDSLIVLYLFPQIYIYLYPLFYLQPPFLYRVPPTVF